MFDARGYGEVATPALEYEAVLTRGDPAAADPAYRLFDEHGNVLVLRSDMTIPIARVVATRYSTSEIPLRFSYVAHAYRAVKPAPRASRGRSCRRGSSSSARPGRTGTAEAITVLCAALDAAGLDSYRVGLGDASLFPRALAARRRARHGGRSCSELASRDLVGLERELRAAGAVELLDLARTRGGVEVVPEGEPLREVYELLAPDVRRARDLRPRPGADARLLHRARCSRSTTPRSGRRSAAAGATTTCSGRFGRALPAVRLGAGRRARARRACWRRAVTT